MSEKLQWPQNRVLWNFTKEGINIRGASVKYHTLSSTEITYELLLLNIFYPIFREFTYYRTMIDGIKIFKL